MNKTMKIILENQLCANTEVHFFIKPGFDTNFNNVTIWTNIDHNNVTVWTNNDHCNFAVRSPPHPKKKTKKSNFQYTSKSMLMTQPQEMETSNQT